MRLFVAVEVPAAIRDDLATLLTELHALESRSSASKLRWVRPENLHVTLRFIGSVPPEKLDVICAELSRVRSDRPVELRFRGLGFFPSAKRPRVLWAGMVASPNLAAIAGDIDKRLAKLEIPAEERAFTPHLTLARFESHKLPEKLRLAIQEYQARDFGLLQTREFHLIESKTKPSGAEYTTLHSFRFAVEA